jgi:hypothetical protein
MIGVQRCVAVLLFTAYYLYVGVTSFTLTTQILPQSSARISPLIKHRLIKNSNRIYSSSSAADIAAETAEAKIDKTLRSQLRTITGFSLTAVRATMRAATGISLTAIYLSALAVSGIWIRQTMKIILDIFPTWARYFVQPILVLYYVPLFMLRNMTAPKQREQEQAHDTLVESWKQAVAVAEHTTSYWPIHLTENGNIESDEEDLDINDAVAKSVEIALETDHNS